MPARSHLVAGGGDHADADRERDPECGGDGQQVKPDQHGEDAEDDDAEREHHPRRHRPPPEGERISACRPEQHETEDEREVRRVEEVVAAEADQVLREDRDGRRAGEDPPPFHAPPVAVLRPGHPEHERDPVPGQEGARRPEDDVLAPRCDPDLEHRAGEE